VSISRKRALRAAVGAACATALFPVPSALAADFTGPSTTVAPYVKGVAPGVDVTSVLTVGDQPAENGYRMAGLPDGMGVRIDRELGVAEVTVNHEIRPDRGIVRAHGAQGAFVSRYRINANERVYSGFDLIKPGVTFWDYVSQDYGTAASVGGVNPRRAGDTFPAQGQAFSRFCSGSLATPAQLKGHSGRGLSGTTMWLANEESGDEGRIFGVTDDGKAKQLPRLGLFSWESARFATTGTNDTTVIGAEDGADGQLWIYNGRKQRTGDAFKRAGLTTGTNHVLDLERKSVTNDAEFRATIGKGVPARFGINTVDWDQSGAAQNAEAKADGLTLNRIEDLHFDPRKPNVLYFVTTEGGDTTPNPADPTTSRNGGGLWKVTFDDLSDPSEGGTIELLLDGSEAPYLSKPDNIGIDGDGNLLIQEDPGNNALAARIVAYNIKTGQRGVVAQFDPALFRGPNAITQDEESSGIEFTGGFFGRNSWIFNAQVHKSSGDAETVEPGQLLTMSVNDWSAVYNQPAPTPTPGV
jgi:Bacterial protein of unknown function (DUF839)